MTDSPECVLITGGAGYIGSHGVLAFQAAGYPVVVLDDLSTGRRSAVGDDVVFIRGDAGDQALVGGVLREHRIGAVVHFAGSVVVPESVADPLKYYGNNTCVSRNLIACCVEHGVRRFIFSSTAAVYGIPQNVPVTEASPTVPINPYGASKLVTEWILRDTAAAHDFAYVALRYFNVSGADPEGRRGQNSRDATHLIEVATRAALGVCDGLDIYGDDYETPDGTCVRDYIHVTDLAEAHVLALEYLRSGGTTATFNLGNGRGHSVREVVETVKRVTGREFAVRLAPRRPGDPACLIADASTARTALRWTPRRAALELQIKDAWNWQQKKQAAESSKP